MHSADVKSFKVELRKTLRAKRRHLKPDKQTQAATDLAAHIAKLECYRDANKVALYLANDGEIATTVILEHALTSGKQCYLPRISAQEMFFLRYERDDPLQTNRYGIPEPTKERESIGAENLDIVLLPLVGFDTSGGRLGMGGGYYDRCFAFRAESISSNARPMLIGLAHHCQEVDRIPHEHWDVSLDKIVSDKGVMFSIASSSTE